MPRTKTYSAQSGFAYQYRFSGHEMTDGSDLYRFGATAPRQSPFEIEIRIPRAAVAAWELAGARALNSTERYAVAKMALFSALDEAATPAAIPHPVIVSAAQAVEILRLLDI